MTKEELELYVGEKVSFDLIPYDSPIYNIGMDFLDKWEVKDALLVKLENENVDFAFIDKDGLHKLYRIDWIKNFKLLSEIN